MYFVTISIGISVLSADAEHVPTQLTIYNQNFTLIKETRDLDLGAGENEVRVTDITAHLEPDSVMLRDVKNQTPFGSWNKIVRATY